MIRLTMIALLMLLGMLPARAQSVMCDTGEMLHAPFMLDAPDIRLNGSISVGSVFGVGTTGDVLPLVQLAVVDEQPVCAGVTGDGMAIGHVDAPDYLTAVYTSAFDVTENSITVGTSGNAGALLTIMVQNDDFSTVQTYTLQVTPQMRASGVPLEIRAYSLETEASPTLEVLNASGAVVSRCAAGEGDCVSIERTLASGVAISAVALDTDPALQVDLNTWPEDTLRFRVSATPHLLVLRAANDVPAASGAVFTDAQGLMCDGLPAWTDGIGISLPNAASVTITALGDGSGEPVLAVVDEDGTRCNQSNPAALLYSLGLPGATVEVQDTSAQLDVIAASQVLVALRDDASGSLYLIIEGLTVDAAGQLIEITPTQAVANAADVLSVWVIAADGTLDPQVTWVTSEGLPVLDELLQPYTCDNAGVPELCYGDSNSLQGTRITLAEGRHLPLSSEDAVLTLPVFTQTAGQPLRLWVSGAHGTQGQAVVVVKLVIGG